MPQTETYVVEPDVVACELAGGAALLDLRTSTYFSLNAVGARVWEALAEPRTVKQVCDAVSETFDTDPKACEADVRAHLLSLEARGLVTHGRG